MPSIYVLMCIITSTVMTCNGFGLFTWQWWVICGCQIGSYICGLALGIGRE